MFATVQRDDLIVSPDRFEKEGRRFQAALDTASSNVVVLREDEPVRSHALAEHFASSTAVSTAEMSRRIESALSAAAPPPMDITSRTFTFLPTSRCNMGCAYCGQEHGDSNAAESANALFRERVLRAIRNERVRHVHVAWFGGEPMLVYRTIMEMATEFVAEATRIGTRYSSKMTTNGVLLTSDRMRALIDGGLVSRFDITVDGPPEIHDKHRPLKAGARSFNRIMRILKWYAQADLNHPCTVVIRTNVDRGNVQHIPEYLNLMKAAGLDDHSRFLYELAPVHSFSNDVSDIALSTPEAATAEIEWMREMVTLGLPFGVLPGKPSTHTCVATNPNSETIGPDGTVFSCVETPLTPMAHLDSLTTLKDLGTDALRPLGKYDAWDAAVEQGAVPCSSCQLRVVCRGACPKLWTEGTPACPTMKLNLDARIELLMTSRGYRKV